MLFHLRCQISEPVRNPPPASCGDFPKKCSSSIFILQERVAKFFAKRTAFAIGIPSPWQTWTVLKIVIFSIYCDSCKVPCVVAALRVFLIVPWCHLFAEPAKWQRLHAPLAKSLAGLGPVPTKVLEYWWTDLPIRHLNRVLKVALFSFLLTVENRHVVKECRLIYVEILPDE